MLTELETSRSNSKINLNNLNNKVNKHQSLNRQDIKIDKENHFKNEIQLVLNRARIESELQPLEAVQINLDPIQLFTCDTDNNLDVNSECYCITHET